MRFWIIFPFPLSRYSNRISWETQLRAKINVIVRWFFEIHICMVLFIQFKLPFTIYLIYRIMSLENYQSLKVINPYTNQIRWPWYDAACTKKFGIQRICHKKVQIIEISSTETVYWLKHNTVDSLQCANTNDWLNEIAVQRQSVMILHSLGPYLYELSINEYEPNIGFRDTCRSLTNCRECKLPASE